MGAPKKEITKSEWLQVRMTHKMKSRAKEQAASLGISLSEYVCRLIKADMNL